MLIVDRYPVASNVLGVPLAFQPVNILPDQIIILKRRLLQPRISIIKPQEKASLVHPRIVVGEDYRPDRTQVQDKVRVRREPSHNHRVLVGVRQRRQGLRPGLTLGRYCLRGHELDTAQLGSISYHSKEKGALPRGHVVVCSGRDNFPILLCTFQSSDGETSDTLRRDVINWSLPNNVAVSLSAIHLNLRNVITLKMSNPIVKKAPMITSTFQAGYQWRNGHLRNLWSWERGEAVGSKRRRMPEIWECSGSLSM